MALLDEKKIEEFIRDSELQMAQSTSASKMRIQSTLHLASVIQDLDKAIQLANKELHLFNFILGALTLILVIFTIGLFIVSLRQIGLI